MRQDWNSEPTLPGIFRELLRWISQQSFPSNIIDFPLIDFSLINSYIPNLCLLYPQVYFFPGGGGGGGKKNLGWQNHGVLFSHKYHPTSLSLWVRGEQRPVLVIIIHFIFNFYTVSLIHYYNLIFAGKTRFLIPGTKHTCMWDESKDSSDEGHDSKPAHSRDFLPRWTVKQFK